MIGKRPSPPDPLSQKSLSEGEQNLWRPFLSLEDGGGMGSASAIGQDILLPSPELGRGAGGEGLESRHEQ